MGSEIVGEDETAQMLQVRAIFFAHFFGSILLLHVRRWLHHVDWTAHGIGSVQ